MHRPNDLKIRPICAGLNCVTSRLSNSVDILLKLSIRHIKSHIRDDIDFLNKLKTDTDEKKVLATFDITSMHTNINNNLGKEVINYWLEKDPVSLPRNISKEFILEALGIALKCNVFFFDNGYYLQIKGMVMGTKLALTYATLVMGYLELKLSDKIEEKFRTEFSKHFKEEWMRYLDDCFINWDTRIAEVTELLLTINNLNQGIKFTMDAHPTKNTFLQILLGVKNNKIITDIYYKPTDTFQFLPFTSCHPKHIKKNVSYNLTRRICTIVDEKDTIDRRT